MSEQKRQKTRTDDSAYNGKHPYVHVDESWAGHQWIVDDTPGEEMIRIRHASGSYHELSSDGKSVTYTVGDSKNYGKGGFSATYDENGDVKIHGHNRLLVGGGSHIEVAGDAGVFIGGDAAIAGIGKVNVRASQVYLGSDGDININSGGAINVKAGGAINMNGATINLNS